MKKLFHLCGCLGVLSLCLGDLDAQTQGPPPLPPGPLLQKMADYSAMQITYSRPDDQAKLAASAKAPPPAPTFFPTVPIRKLTLTRTKPIWHAVRVDIYGNSVGKWYDGAEYFYEVAGISQPLYCDTKVDGFRSAAVPDFSRCDFPDMDWVSPQTYVGVEAMGAGKCLVFKKGDMTAWIDLESRFPVQWKQGVETRTFQQLAPPTEPLVLPLKIAALAAALKYDHDKWKRLEMRLKQQQGG